VGSCEHGNELLGSIKDEKLLDHLLDCHLFKKNRVPWSYLHEQEYSYKLILHEEKYLTDFSTMLLEIRRSKFSISRTLMARRRLVYGSSGGLPQEFNFAVDSKLLKFRLETEILFWNL
jgi:hypothetical protein